MSKKIRCIKIKTKCINIQKSIDISRGMCKNRAQKKENKKMAQAKGG